MAGEWIKMRTSLLTDPRVNGIARALEKDARAAKALSVCRDGVMSDVVTRNVMRHVTVSSLLVVWGAANEHTKDGVFRNADLSDVDDMVGVPGFGEALQSVGWAVYDADSCTVTLPNFNEYNTSGRERGVGSKTAAERQKEYRGRKKVTDCDVMRDVTGDVTSDVTRYHREEKRREEKKEEIQGEVQRKRSTPTPTIDRPADVDQQTWSDWLALRKAKKAPVTATVVDGARVEAGKAGIALIDFLRVWCTRGSQGLEADWLKPNERSAGARAPAESFRESDRKAAEERWSSFTGNADASHRDVIDITPETLEIEHASAQGN